MVAKLFVYLMEQDDPKKCTSKKLCRFGLALPIYSRRRIPRGAVVLDPIAPRVLTPLDRPLAEFKGIVAIDCSWERAAEVFSKPFREPRRRLPLLLAANPVNYGKLAKLSSAEALAAALYICGLRGEAEAILSLFKWGRAFIDLNHGPLEEYSRASSPAEIFEIEASYFGASSVELIGLGGLRK